mmetsp:Transcript_1851/g.6643  ORF Transcript_1851/g.6643 Transcript_1851/m.6643 type:complete len:299 (-) Transcript_1851:132-1028(-)
MAGLITRVAGATRAASSVSRTLRASSFVQAPRAVFAAPPACAADRQAGFRTMPPIMMGRRSAKIAGRKGKEDALRSKLYGKIGKQIVQAVKAGGPDPVANQHLGDILKVAKQANVPKDIIDRNVNKASDKNQADYQYITYEAYGVGGVGLVIEALTDNVNRAISDVRDAVNKGGGKMAESGSVMFNFQRQGWIYLEGEAGEDEVMEVVLDAGADDVIAGEGDDGQQEVKVVCPMDSFGAVRDAIVEADLKMAADKSGLVYAPLAEAEISDEDYDLNMALIERILDVGDVDAVHSSFEQ